MPYCPNCEAEYRDGVQRCSDCDSELVDTLPEHDPPEVDTLGVGLVELASFPLSAEADMIRELLETNGIRCVIRGDSDPIGAASMAAPTTLLVEQRDLERARGLYDAFFAGDEAAEETPSAENE
jgi:hypothetical protein